MTYKDDVSQCPGRVSDVVLKQNPKTPIGVFFLHKKTEGHKSFCQKLCFFFDDFLTLVESASLANSV